MELDQHKGQKRAHHDEFSVGDVQDPGNAVLNAHAHGDNGVDAAHDQSAAENIEKFYQHRGYS